MTARYLLPCCLAVAAGITSHQAAALDKPGLYAGGFVGWVQAHTEAEANPGGRPAPDGETILNFSATIEQIVNGDAESFSGGGLIGYGLGAGRLLGAIEADFAVSDAESSGEGGAGAYDTVYDISGALESASSGEVSSTRDANFSLRIVGAFDIGHGLRAFGTAGLAVGRVSHSAVIEKTDSDSTNPDGKGSVSKWATGWTAGAGVVADLGGHWALRAEYRYVDLGTTDLSVKFSDDSVTVVRFEDTEHSVRLGLIYHFGT